MVARLNADLQQNNMSLQKTRKRALHARMSHGTVCNTTVSTKKARRTLVKIVRQLRVTPHACKGNTPVNVKEKYVFVQAIKRRYGYGCVHVCVIIKQISSSELLVHDVDMWEYNTIFNTKYCIISSKILPYVVAIVQRC